MDHEHTEIQDSTQTRKREVGYEYKRASSLAEFENPFLPVSDLQLSSSNFLTPRLNEIFDCAQPTFVGRVLEP